MGVLDFLFEGSPPPSTTTYGSTVENMPQWLSDYTQGLIARANMVADEGYQAFPGPRVAGFTDDQTNAFDVIRNNIGDWNDEFDSSKAATSGALTQAMPFFGQAAQTTPQAIQSYMDPYVGGVIDRAKLEANRHWDESIMPSIRNRFITSGQSGSTGHQELLQRAGRDVTEGLNSQAMAALSDAWKTAGSQFSTDASRLAGIGRDVGNLGLQTGQQMSGLAELEQALKGRDAASLQAVGDTRQQQNQRNLDVAYQNFQDQRNYPRQTLDWMSSIIRGIPHDTTRTTTETGPGNNFQPSPISQLISLYGLYKDVTDKARGGVVRKASGGVVSGPMSRGQVIHTPGPVEGFYRYAEGGEVDRDRAVRHLRETADRLDNSGPTRRGGPRKEDFVARQVNYNPMFDTPGDAARRTLNKRFRVRYGDEPIKELVNWDRAQTEVRVGRGKGPTKRYAHGGLACLEY